MIKARTDRAKEVLTLGEIESRHPGEWVLIEDRRTDATHKVRAGKVAFHGKDRDEVYRKAIELRPRRFATLYTGTIAEDSAIVL